MLRITKLWITKFSVLEIQHGRKFLSGNNCEGKILAVTEVLEVQMGSCDKDYVCSLKYFIFPNPAECSTIVAQIHRVF
jgi:hypothetical protein